MSDQPQGPEVAAEFRVPSPWYRLEASAAGAALRTDLARGLAEPEAAARRARFGPNALEERGGRSPWRLLLDQFASTLVIVLLIAAAVSAAVGSFKDAVAIFAIVLLNAALGFTQEYRAERAMAALRELSSPKVRVRREGARVELPSSELEVLANLRCPALRGDRGSGRELLEGPLETLLLPSCRLTLLAVLPSASSTRTVSGPARGSSRASPARSPFFISLSPRACSIDRSARSTALLP
jgi:hypothetical protein